MRLRLQFVPLAVLSLATPVGPTDAGPVNGPVGALARAGGDVEPAAAQCGRKGQAACPAPRRPPGWGAPTDYYVHDANKLPFGSERWRDQMRRENRLGNPG